MRAANVPVIDCFQFGGAVQVPAIVSYSMKWHASGPFVPAANGGFSGNFAPATVEGALAPPDRHSHTQEKRQ